MKEYSVYREIAELSAAITNCHGLANPYASIQHATLDWIMKQFMPSGAGIDAGVKLESCTKEKMVFSFSFHHMNSVGYYTGWTEHKLIVKPAWAGIDLYITGRDKNGLKDYLYDVFDYALSAICRRLDPDRGVFVYGWYFDDKWVNRPT